MREARARHRAAPARGSSSPTAASQVEHARGPLPAGFAPARRGLLPADAHDAHGAPDGRKGVRSVRQISADVADPHLNRIFASGSNPTHLEFHPNSRRDGSNPTPSAPTPNQTHGK